VAARSLAVRAAPALLPQDVINKNRQELVSQLGLHAHLCDELYTTVAANICPEPRSALDCLRAKQAHVSFLPTGMASLDKTLRGGLPCGSIIEVVGPAGAGKTQFCLQSCVRAIGESDALGSAIYIDTVCHAQFALLALHCLLAFPARYNLLCSASERLMRAMEPQESRFSAERLLEIAQVEYPNFSRELQHKLVERCTVFSVQSTHELTQTLSSIDEV
jgi:hypothetical protein